MENNNNFMPVDGKPLLELMKEQNIERLARSGMLAYFARVNRGSWNHDEWLNLCDDISMSSYFPVDFDKAGLILENEKSNYFRPMTNENKACPAPQSRDVRQEVQDGKTI
jgi:hypothetical protein